MAPKRELRQVIHQGEKVREILGLSAPLNKTDRPTYLGNVKEYLIVTADKIEDGQGLPLRSSYLLDQLQTC